MAHPLGGGQEYETLGGVLDSHIYSAFYGILNIILIIYFERKKAVHFPESPKRVWVFVPISSYIFYTFPNYKKR